MKVGLSKIQIRYAFTMGLLKMTIVALLVYLLLGCGSGAARNAAGTEKQLFDQDWDFHLGSVDSLAAFTDTTLYTEKDTAIWRKVTLPHDWSIEGSFSREHPAGNQGGALPGGIGWYRKLFVLPAADSAKNILIRFDGVYRYSKVWLNGHFLGERPSGFISFDYALTPYLYFDGRPNILIVRVDNSRQPNSRWYTGSGINRDVWLVKQGPVSIHDRESFFYATVDARAGAADTAAKKAEKATLNQHLVLNYTLSSLRPVEIETVIYDQQHHMVAQKKESWRPEKTAGAELLDWSLPLENVWLWSPDHPYLYTLEVTLKQNGSVMDQLRLPLGIRYFHFDPQKGFFLNGQPTKIKGVCLHNDYGVLGTAYNYSAMFRQLKLLKEMGCNAIRTAHNPPPPGMLDLCDSMGFLVMDEAFDMWQKKKTKYDYSRDFARWHRQDLADQIKRDRRHPSVFMWSIGNEIREQFDTSGIRLTRELVALVKALDTTRPVIAGLTETHPDKNNIAKADALDVLGFNYKPFDYDSLPLRFPGKPLVASETVSALETRGVYKHMPKDSILYMPSGPGQKFAENSNGDWTVSAYDKVAAYWGTTHEHAWRAVKSRPFIAGTFVWTAIDYLGEPVPFPYPARSSYYGIIDQAGLVKDVYYFYQSEWTAKPVLHILPHWNWHKGEVVDVWCYYSQADQVELFLNGRSLGKRHKTDGQPGDNEFHISWKVPYEPGVLKAVSSRNGKVVLTREIKTAAAPRKIQVKVDTSAFRGVAGDLCYVSIQLEDADGIPVPDDDRTLHFDVEGAATLVGVNNGYQADLHSFRSKDYNTWKGKCVAVIRPTTGKGVFKLHITGEGLTDQTATIAFGK